MSCFVFTVFTMYTIEYGYATECIWTNIYIFWGGGGVGGGRVVMYLGFRFSLGLGLGLL